LPPGAYLSQVKRRDIVLRPENCRRDRLAKCLISWLLAALLPLQGMAAGALGARGPLHMHRAEARLLVLEDFRRAPTMPAPMHSAIAFGHVHGDGAALRHFHRFDDATVVARDDGGLGHAGGSTSAALDHATSAPAALLPAALAWAASVAMQAPASRLAWPSLTFEPEPFERPPRWA
jgi:hypothetical protein